jgi:cullin-4
MHTPTHLPPHTFYTPTPQLPKGIDMSVSVLTSGFWPTYPVADAKLPQELEESQAVFKEFYLNKYSGRKLVWHSPLGTCVLRAQFPK